ncbi:hypothetical protein FHS89_002935 [Rubricella aquisinus]|uniref:DUF2157 domain-containing protein n=1 Tax=Rubricella aquisinus TaxID=2028108 RepID=A0A840WQB4_9RHOB|nr:hypothetical protein [Rubricella aquisinus]MBB5516891.1 hypothetical protein [Rubricella aquisinus]
MTDISQDDLRAAVEAGRISEAQAASLIALAQARSGARSGLRDAEEPFELFRGFNEVFVVVGLCVLLGGWLALALGAFSVDDEPLLAVFSTILSVAVLFVLSHYFIKRRRMVGPALLLTVSVVVSGLLLSSSVIYIWNDMEDPLGQRDLLLLFGIGLAVSGIHWWQFRVPIALGAIALLLYGFAVAILSPGWDVLNDPGGLFLLTGRSYVGVLTLLFGIGTFAMAMRFDLKDRFRVTRNTANAFWLHTVAATFIVSTIAVSLMQSGGWVAYGLLALFLVFMATVAIVVDRRSFIMAGIGYVIALSFTLFSDDGAPYFVLLLGIVLTLLGAKWADLRRGLMGLLPLGALADKLPPTKDML